MTELSQPPASCCQNLRPSKPLTFTPLALISFLVFLAVSVWRSQLDGKLLRAAVLGSSCAIGRSTTGVASDSFLNEMGS